MNKISNYQELVAERRRTELIIADRKELIHDKMEDVKEKLAPVFYILSGFKALKSNNSNNSLWKTGSSVAIDLLVGQKLLKSSGWLTKLVIPPLLKMISSRVIDRVKK